MAAEWKPDLIFALALAPLSPAILERLRTAGLTCAFWWIENHRVLPYWRVVAPLYDWFYAIQPGAFMTRLSEAGARRPRYLPLACDPERHAQVVLTAVERRRFGADVSFAGSPYLNRRQIFAALADLRLRLWGAGWSDAALAPLQAEGGKSFTLDEMLRIFAATKINLNLHSAEHVPGLDPEPDYVNPRTFELAACGAFQLVDHRSPLPDLFTNEEVVTFASVPELRSLIGRYLDDDGSRQAIAARARTRALAEHTYCHRMQQVFRDALSPELAAAAFAGLESESLDDAIARAVDGDTMGREETLLLALREVRGTWIDKR
jgi:spore maturation protein CgeB